MYNSKYIFRFHSSAVIVEQSKKFRESCKSAFFPSNSPNETLDVQVHLRELVESSQNVINVEDTSMIVALNASMKKKTGMQLRQGKIETLDLKMNSERDIYQNAKFMQVYAFLKCLLFIAQVWTRNLDGIIANIRITPVLQ